MGISARKTCDSNSKHGDLASKHWGGRKLDELAMERERGRGREREREKERERE